MELVKNLLLLIIKPSISILIGMLLTFWISGSKEIEYRDNYRAPYFNFPDAIEKDLEIRHKTTPIDNISVVEYAIHNRTFTDLENIKIYVKIKDDKEYKLISQNLAAPKKIPNIGINPIDTKVSEVFGFEVDVLKKTGSDYYYHLSLIFEGNEAPEAEISIGNRNIEIVKYKKWKDNALAVLAVFTVYIIVLIPFGIFIHFSSKREKTKFIDAFKSALSSRLNDEDVNFTINKYEEIRNPKKDNWLNKIWSAIMSKKSTSTK